MIEYIEEFCAKIERSRLRDTCILVKSEVPLVKPRSMEEAPLCVACSAQSFGEKGRHWRIKVGVVGIGVSDNFKEKVARFSRVQVMDPLAVVVRRVCAATAAKGGIVALTKLNRETCGETGDP